jgi:hypothetical protein
MIGFPVSSLKCALALRSLCESQLHFNKGENKMATKNKPMNTLRCGNIKATIWQNRSENGTFFSTTFSRPFKDQSGVWRNGSSFGLNDLDALLTVAQQAKEWIADQIPKP